MSIGSGSVKTATMAVQGLCSAEEVEKHSQVFDAMPIKDGRISGEDAKAVMLQSGLAEADLETIWSVD